VLILDEPSVGLDPKQIIETRDLIKSLAGNHAAFSAYILLIMFGLILGFFFWNALGFFVIEGMEMQMRGQMFPMNPNEQIIRPLLSNVSVIGLPLR